MNNPIKSFSQRENKDKLSETTERNPEKRQTFKQVQRRTNIKTNKHTKKEIDEQTNTQRTIKQVKEGSEKYSMSRK